MWPKLIMLSNNIVLYKFNYIILVKYILIDKFWPVLGMSWRFFLVESHYFSIVTKYSQIWGHSFTSPQVRVLTLVIFLFFLFGLMLFSPNIAKFSVAFKILLPYFLQYVKQYKNWSKHTYNSFNIISIKMYWPVTIPKWPTHRIFIMWPIPSPKN